MKIYNTLSGKKEEIKKTDEKKLFVCGVTVYDLAHIGHARTALAFDVIVKYLRSRDWDIHYVQNVTDVDDKIIKRAKENNKNPFDVARKYEDEYLKDMETLGVDSVDKYPRASDFIDEIIDQVSRLISKDFAYQTKNGIYFEVRKFKDYGKLSGQDIDELESGSRVDVDENKKDPLDFALWKIRNEKAESSKKIKDAEKKDERGPILVDGEPLWKSPWGWGRPGWHIEDTAISEELLGEQYDIHGGAEDLKFPHHESEIAQQEAASGKKPFVQFWMHAGLLNVEGEKMSKSLDNFITIRDFLKNHPPNLLRWMVLNHHYRSKMNYTKKVAKQSMESLITLDEFLQKLKFIRKKGEKDKKINISKKIESTEEKFHSAMEDDFNTPKALSHIFKLINKLQENIWKIDKKSAKKTREFITNTLKSLGLNLEHESVPREVLKLVDKREKLRGNEQFVQADKLREKMRVLGYEIEDTPLGPFAKKVIKK